MMDFESSNAAALNNTELKIDESIKKSMNFKTNIVDETI